MTVVCNACNSPSARIVHYLKDDLPTCSNCGSEDVEESRPNGWLGTLADAKQLKRHKLTPEKWVDLCEEFNLDQDGRYTDTFIRSVLIEYKKE